MNIKKHLTWGDPDMELVISRIMRYGIVVASVIVIIGSVTFLSTHGKDKPQYATFNGQPKELTNVFRIISSLSSTNGLGLIEFGMVVLIAIPVLRVAFSIASFIAEKDKVYVIITSLVFILLLYSLLGQQ